MTIGILNQMIHLSARVDLTERYSKSSVILIEPQAPDSMVEIRGIPDNAVVIKMDKFPDLRNFLSNSRHECSRADFAIIAESNKKKIVLFIEMKKTKAKECELIEQLHGARCVLTYCEEVGKRFYNCRDFLAGYEYRYVSFYKTSIRKTGSRTILKQNKRHDTPEKMLKISFPNNIQFNHLIGG